MSEMDDDRNGNGNNPAVSIVIPVYNRLRLLEEAVESVIGQTFTNWELIIVDDGSEDGNGVEQYFDELCHRDARIRCLSIPHCGMAGAVRNRGVELVRGAYLAFLDSDDIWLPQKLQLQYPFSRDGQYRLTHTRERWLRNGREISQKGQKHRSAGDIWSDALHKCIIGPSTVMMETALFRQHNGFNEQLEIAEDYELWLRLCHDITVGYIDQPLTVKRAGHSGQLSDKYGQIEIFRIRALEILRNSDALPATAREPLKTELCRKYWIYANGCEKRGRLQEARAMRREAESLT